MQNNLSDIIASLMMIHDKHGDLPCFTGDMQPFNTIDLKVGADNVEPETYPDGFVHFGEW